MTSVWQDLRYGVRMLWKNPGVTAVAVFALALGIGANTAIFSVVNGVLLRPLSFPAPDQLVQIWENNPQQGRTQLTVSPHNFADWQGQSQTINGMAAYKYESFILTNLGDAPERIVGSQVSAGFFRMLAVAPGLGRDFLQTEDQPGADRVVILSHRLWQRRFGSDPKVVGQTLTLNSEGFTVVGIMPPDFRFPSQSVDLWAPLVLNLKGNRSAHFLQALGRLKPGINLKQAQAEMDAIAHSLAQQYPESNKDSGVTLVPLHQQITGNIRPALLVLLGAVCLVLLIACANVANLLLARATGRHKEIAVRIALGASRWRLIQQLLTESVLLAVLGGGFGLLLAMWGIDLLVAWSAGAIPRAREIGVDAAVLGFTGFVSLLTGVIFGLAPALGSSKPNLNESLKEGSKGMAGGFRRNRLRGALVISEVALTLVLLITAGLLIKSFSTLLETDPGFNPENVLTLQLSLPQATYPEGDQQRFFFQQILERIEALPGVQHVGAVNDLPFSGSRTSSSFDIEGRPSAPNESRIADDRKISPGYFRAMGIPLVRGREFTERDTKDAPRVAIINETMARRFFEPNEDPLGKRLLIGDPAEAGRTGQSIGREIIGVVGDIKHDDLTAKQAPEMYMSYLQYPHSWMFLAVRSTVPSEALVAAIRSAVQEVDRDQAVYSVLPMNQRLTNSVAQQRFNTLLLGIFAGVALMLATVGIYGVMSYSVSMRTHEIGVRIALGAQAGDVLRLVIGQGMFLVLIGVVTGLAAALLLAGVMTSLLYGVSVRDPAIFISMPLLLTAVALIACYIPARRAMKVEPGVALRHE